MSKIDIDGTPEKQGSTYPAPYDAACKERRFRRLGEAAGLTQLGASHVRLPPGTWSSQRHWHALEDELVVVLEGEVVLVTDEGEQLLRAGDCAAFKAGVRNGHCVQNRSDKDAVLLAVSNRSDDDWGEYSDIDLTFTRGGPSGKPAYLRKDGTPYK
jgi:uncharacterized cupin superfamily protein